MLEAVWLAPRSSQAFQGSNHYSPHFTDEEAEAQEG